ncbi:MAG: TrbC/VirB2 family protein [Candidatus Paceibacterota bacterium]|jgi:hypothetical protein
MKFFKKNWGKITLAVYLFIIPIFTLYAQGSGTEARGGKIENPIPSITSVPGLIQKILEGMLKIGIPVVALAIIYCGFLFVFARGNSEKLSKAKEALMYTLIGAAILLGSWAIAKMISATVLAL